VIEMIACIFVLELALGHTLHRVRSLCPGLLAPPIPFLPPLGGLYGLSDLEDCSSLPTGHTCV
jgi:hypothetical protein